MKGMVFVELGGLTGAALEQWINAAAAFTRTLPPKHPRPPSARKAGGR